MKPKHKSTWFESLKWKPVDKYKLGDFVGAGKIGYVYRAQHKEFPGAEWAVKLVFDKLKPGWKNEVRKVMSLALVPGVVHFHGLGTAQITHEDKTHLCQYTVWDYISPGENLRRYLERVGNIQNSFLFSVVNQILHVLHACQEKGVVRHGDLHSGNILIGDATTSTLDDALERRAPIFVSDFGYGATGAVKMPKDDYEGLANIINEMIKRLD
jgi:serine/threonine protein kinase